MSEHTAAVALDAMLVTDLDDDAFGWEMFALLEAIDFEFEPWCRVAGLDPDLDATFERWQDLNWRYIDTWKEIGTDLFVARTGERVDKWRRLLSRKGLR